MLAAQNWAASGGGKDSLLHRPALGRLGDLPHPATAVAGWGGPPAAPERRRGGGSPSLLRWPPSSGRPAWAGGGVTLHRERIGGTMTRKRFRTISSSSQPPVPPSQEATASQEATPSQPPAHPSEQATMPSSDYDQSLNDNEIIETVYNPRASIGDIVKSWFLKDLGEKWRNYKYVNLEQFCKLVDFWYSDAGRHRSHAGKQNRSLQTTVHTAGSKSFARYAHELRRMEEIGLNDSGSSQTSDEFRVDGSIGWSPSDRYAQVIGPERHGRIRGVGLGPTPSSHPANTNVRSSQPASSSNERAVFMENRVQMLESEVASLKSTIQMMAQAWEQRQYQDVPNNNHVSPAIHRSSHASRKTSVDNADDAESAGADGAEGGED
ncbi:hypothetical protein CJ030_MR8G016254 [Morella rubra]|uniref:Uncharacterized protein n=1 Tax=Morella rubra TaxID=262757 RepID=A0A6A1UU48_9ROSI|nr:hypothetical protein CJ030_MR8G016254 [Morella rubra]